MQITRGMRIGEAKAYVAERLGVSPFDLSDPIAMEDVRRERQLGRITTFEISYPTQSSAMEAKFRIAELLDLPINCVQRFRRARRTRVSPVVPRAESDRIGGVTRHRTAARDASRRGATAVGTDDPRPCAALARR